VTAIKISLVVLLVVLLLGVALRVRKVRRDEERRVLRSRDRRLVVPPPSPYEPSRGFRLLDGTEKPSQPSAPSRPRLEPDKKYVFSDYHPSNPDFASLSSSRRDTEWALSRSSNRSNWSVTGPRVVVIVIVVVIVLGFVGYYEHDYGSHHRSSTTSTVTTTTL
jgi:hypothetical protein